MFIGNLSDIGGKDYLAFIRTWKVMFNRHELFNQKDAVGTVLTNKKMQFLGFLFTHLLPAVSLWLILYAPPIVRARILCLLTYQVPVVRKPISNNIIDVARLIKHTLWPLTGF